MKFIRLDFLVAAFTILTIIAVGLLLIFPNLLNESRVNKAVQYKQQQEKKLVERFELADPAQAPSPIRELVRQGYQIMLDTPKYASSYVGDRVSCTSCHFAGGDTTGFKNGGIALAGVAAAYPKYDQREGKVMDLQARINNCFERSMNGKALPLDSNEMLSLTAYLHWISRGIPIYQPVPWLGLPTLKSTHQPNSESGKAIYLAQCALCHGKEGQGEVHNAIPPVWGPDSYNDTAGMNEQTTLASFLFYNMPYMEASLTEEQAIDVAAYIGQQSRPQYHK